MIQIYHIVICLIVNNNIKFLWDAKLTSSHKLYPESQSLIRKPVLKRFALLYIIHKNARRTELYNFVGNIFDNLRVFSAN